MYILSHVIFLVNKFSNVLASKLII